MTVTWVHVVLLAFSSLASGFIGGWVVAFRMGSWRQRVEDRLTTAEERLEKGNPHVDKIPLLAQRVDTLILIIEEVKVALRDFTRDVVTRRECDRRHADAGQRGS